jgi:hypothetical protein
MPKTEGYMSMHSFPELFDRTWHVRGNAMLEARYRGDEIFDGK